MVNCCYTTWFRPDVCWLLSLLVLKTLNILLLFISSVLFFFALISGAEDLSFQAILSNSPNAWPWFLLLLLNILAWKRPKIAGVLITLFGLLSTYYFNFTFGRFYLLVFVITLAITLIGMSLFFVARNQKFKNS